jgi:hypothetical protein
VVHEVNTAERLAKSTMIKIVFLIVNFFKKLIVSEVTEQWIDWRFQRNGWKDLNS